MDEIRPKCAEWMKFLGNFGPTVLPQRREVKGYMWDPDDGGGYKAYLSSTELRELATACVEMAEWLDKRADSAGDGNG